MNKDKINGILLTTIGAACWGLSGSVGQYLFSVQKMDSRWLVPIRLGLAGILILIYSLQKYKDLVFAPWKSRSQAITTLIYGLGGVAACQYFYFRTIELSNAAIGTILQDLSPVFILAYTCITKRRMPKFLEILSILMAFLGVFLLTTHGNVKEMAVSEAALFAGLMSAICAMIYNVLADDATKGVPVIIVQGWSFLIGSICIMLIFRSWTIQYVPNVYGMLGILFVVVIGNISAYTLYISGVKLIGPSKAVLYSFAEPLTAAIISTLFLGSTFTVIDALGFALIFVMLWLITLVK